MTGPLVAAAYHWGVPEADFAIQHAGGCREEIPARDFTHGNAFSVLPFFSDTLVTLKMTETSQIRRVLEDAFNFFLDPELGGGDGSYPNSAGLRWHVDYTKPFGERVSELEMILVKLPGQWEPLD